MKLSVSRIPETGIEQEIKLSISLSEETSRSDVSVYIKVERYNERVLVEGTASSISSLICGRCLKHFSLPLSIIFKTEYVPHSDYNVGIEHELTANEMDINFYYNDEIDIDSLVKEHMLLAVPMKPLCSSGCKGICSQCGENLNDRDCSCETGSIDPRLETLKKFKEGQ
jgi:uncharacterized protein